MFAKLDEGSKVEQEQLTLPDTTTVSSFSPPVEIVRVTELPEESRRQQQAKGAVAGKVKRRVREEQATVQELRRNGATTLQSAVEHKVSRTSSTETKLPVAVQDVQKGDQKQTMINNKVLVLKLMKETAITKETKDISPPSVTVEDEVSETSEPEDIGEYKPRMRRHQEIVQSSEEEVPLNKNVELVADHEMDQEPPSMKENNHRGLNRVRQLRLASEDGTVSSSDESTSVRNLKAVELIKLHIPQQATSDEQQTAAHAKKKPKHHKKNGVLHSSKQKAASASSKSRSKTSSKSVPHSKKQRPTESIIPRTNIAICKGPLVVGKVHMDESAVSREKRKWSSVDYDPLIDLRPRHGGLSPEIPLQNSNSCSPQSAVGSDLDASSGDELTGTTSHAHTSRFREKDRQPSVEFSNEPKKNVKQKKIMTKVKERGGVDRAATDRASEEKAMSQISRASSKEAVNQAGKKLGPNKHFRNVAISDSFFDASIREEDGSENDLAGLSTVPVSGTDYDGDNEEPQASSDQAPAAKSDTSGDEEEDVPVNKKMEKHRKQKIAKAKSISLKYKSTKGKVHKQLDKEDRKLLAREQNVLLDPPLVSPASARDAGKVKGENRKEAKIAKKKLKMKKTEKQDTKHLALLVGASSESEIDLTEKKDYVDKKRTKIKESSQRQYLDNVADTPYPATLSQMPQVLDPLRDTVNGIRGGESGEVREDKEKKKTKLKKDSKSKKKHTKEREPLSNGGVSELMEGKSKQKTKKVKSKTSAKSQTQKKIDERSNQVDDQDPNAFWLTGSDNDAANTHSQGTTKVKENEKKKARKRKHDEQTEERGDIGDEEIEEHTRKKIKTSSKPKTSKKPSEKGEKRKRKKGSGQSISPEPLSDVLLLVNSADGGDGIMEEEGSSKGAKAKNSSKSNTLKNKKKDRVHQPHSISSEPSSNAMLLDNANDLGDNNRVRKKQAKDSKKTKTKKSSRRKVTAHETDEEDDGDLSFVLLNANLEGSSDNRGGKRAKAKHCSKSKSSEREQLEREEEEEEEENKLEDELDQTLSATLLSTNMSDIGHEDAATTDEDEPSERTEGNVVDTVSTSLAGYHSKHRPVSQKVPHERTKRESLISNATLVGVNITRLSIGAKRSLSSTCTSSVLEDSQMPASKRRKTLLNKKKMLSGSQLSIVEDEVSVQCRQCIW